MQTDVLKDQAQREADERERKAEEERKAAEEAAYVQYTESRITVHLSAQEI